MKKFPSIITLFFILISNYSFCQFKIIPTNNSQMTISYISKIGPNVLIGGNKNFLVKCYDNCDTIYNLNSPGEVGNNNASVARIDTNTIFVCSNNFGQFKGTLYKSIGGGLNWEAIYEQPNTVFYSIAMTQNKYIALGSISGTYYTSSDSGNTWQMFDNAGANEFYTAKSYRDSCLYLAQNGFVMSTCNLFQSWESGNFGFYEPDGLHILNKDTLIMCATGNAQNNKSMMSYSINGGLDWTVIEYSTGIYFNDIYFKNKNEGYIVGYKFLGVNKGIILKTTDFGQSFTEIITPFNVQLSKIEFINDSIALLGGTNGLLVQWNTKIPITTSIEKIESNTFVIYPNPATNVLTIENSNTNSLINQIIIQNSIGENVKEFKNTNQVSNQINLDISSIPSGIYFIKIIDLKGTLNTQKFIKLN